jgi:hypothetical protein
MRLGAARVCLLAQWPVPSWALSWVRPGPFGRGQCRSLQHCVGTQPTPAEDVMQRHYGPTRECPGLRAQGRLLCWRSLCCCGADADDPSRTAAPSRQLPARLTDSHPPPQPMRVKPAYSSARQTSRTALLQFRRQPWQPRTRPRWPCMATAFTRISFFSVLQTGTSSCRTHASRCLTTSRARQPQKQLLP